MKNYAIEQARHLRKRQTDAERKLWSLLRNRNLAGVKFKRQFPIDKYILDFYSHEYKLCVEADGGQHYTDEGKEKDEIRTAALSELGIQVLRFSDREILLNSAGVCEVIQRTITAKKPLTSILSPGRGSKN